MPGPNEDSPSNFRYRELSGDIAQTHLAFGWRTPAALHVDTPHLDVAAAVLAMGRSSRLYRAVRERRYASSVSAYNYTPTELGVFVAETEGPPERAWDAARATWSEIQAFGETGPVEAELERTRRMTDARWSRRLETMDGQANFLAEWEALGDWHLAAEYYERAMSATPAQVRDAAARYLNASDAAFLVYRPNAAPVFAANTAAGAPCSPKAVSASLRRTKHHAPPPSSRATTQRSIQVSTGSTASALAAMFLCSSNPVLARRSCTSVCSHSVALRRSLTHRSACRHCWCAARSRARHS